MYALTYSETYYQDDPGCTQDHEHSYCEQPSGRVTVTPLSLHTARREFSRGYEAVTPASVVYECEPVRIGGTAYVVIVEYTDGGTFGYDGYWTVAGVYRSPTDAERCREACEGPNDTAFAYRPWDGYFASLGEARVEPMTVLY